MDLKENQIPSSFDDFVNPQPKDVDEEENEKQTLEERFKEERDEWSSKIKKMSKKLKKVLDIAELMTYIYTERQRALEYYHYLIFLLIKLNKYYKKAYAAKYEFYTYKSQKRFPNETTKNTQIQAELENLLEKREILDNHSKFILSTISTVDNIIYGLKSRIEIEQIARGK